MHQGVTSEEDLSFPRYAVIYYISPIADAQPLLYKTSNPDDERILTLALSYSIYTWDALHISPLSPKCTST